MDYEFPNITALNITTKSLNQSNSSAISWNSLISFAINISFSIVSFIGNPLTICVVLRERFRSTSTGFYILCLAIYDMLFIIFWPLETTTGVSVIRTLISTLLFTYICNNNDSISSELH